MKRPRGSPPSTVEVWAAAKVNVGWRVGARRPDGYHEVQGCLQTISIVDKLVLRAGADALVVDGPEAAAGLEGQGNLVLDAARVLAEDREAKPTTIALTKNIPVAAGLGGGSADAAAALTGLALAWSADLSPGELLARAARVGSDVPAIVVGGLVHVSGRGELVRNIGCIRGCSFVVGVPSGSLSTADVYAHLDRIRAAGGPERSQSLCANDLEAAAVDLAPDVAAGLGAMRSAGAVEAFVAGSGPAVVGVVADPGRAEAVAGRVRGQFRRVLVADPLPWGVRLVVGGGH